jgi:hypothetical protein
LAEKAYIHYFKLDKMVCLIQIIEDWVFYSVSRKQTIWKIFVVEDFFSFYYKS